MNDIQKKECLDLARKVRLHCLNMVYRGKSGHIGSMLSTADVYSVLYTRVLNVFPEQPEKESRDRYWLRKFDQMQAAASGGKENVNEETR